MNRNLQPGDDVSSALDFEDHRLIHALQIRPRASWTELAQVLGRHPQTVRSRYERLVSAGIVWTVGHLSGDPEQGLLAFVSLRCSTPDMGAVAAGLDELPDVMTIERVTGAWDFRATVVSLSPRHFLTETAVRIQELPGVERTDIEVATRLIAAGHQWQLNALDPAERAALGALSTPVRSAPRSPSSVVLDCLPWLARDGRISFHDLAAATGHHPTTIRRHLEAAERSRLLFFRCEVSQDATPFPLNVQWSARVEPTGLPALRAFLQAQPELRLAYESTGEANAAWSMWLKTPADIARIEWELHRRLPAVTILRSSLGARTLKRMGHALTPAGRREVTAKEAAEFASNSAAVPLEE
jgi:DNA-binding Lrp family transcriptional regulator